MSVADDQAALLAECASEPIHIPGAIQPHGALLAVGLRDGSVVMASANSERFLGDAPQQLLGRRLAEIVGEPTEANVLRVARGAVSDNRVVTLPGPHGDTLDALVHGRDGVGILEIQRREDDDSPAVHLHRVRSALALSAAGSVEALLEAAVDAFGDLTGHERVLVYRFDTDGHGEVAAERRAAHLDPYLGLRYPASDIPPQARRLLLEQPLRVLVDVDYEPQPITPAANPYTGRPLDLGRSLLRSISPVHRQYLRNMGVAASLSVALVHDGRLWGMVTCHHTSPQPVSIALGESCRLVGAVLADRIAAVEDEERHTHRVRLARVNQRLVDALASPDGSAADALAGREDDLLGLTGADGALVHLGGQPRHVGRVPPIEVVEGVRRQLAREPGLLATDALGRVLDGPVDDETASGVLGLRVPGEAGDHVVWFRGELVRAVVWGGDPRTPVEADPAGGGGGALRPRTSFAAWQETVRGQSAPWRSWEVDAAAELGRAVRDTMRLRHASRLASEDHLTGLLNRSAFDGRLQEALRRLEDDRAGSLGLLFVDLDRFKEVNDGFGHAAGDRLLVAVADRLRDVVRATDVVARYGGDEFVVLAEHHGDRHGLERLADRLLRQANVSVVIDGTPHLVTLSVGHATIGHGGTAEELLRRADEAMYRAKRAGRNRAEGDAPAL